MAADEYDDDAQPPGPDPALRRLDRFVGTWEVRGRTLDAEEDNVSGRLTFEWLPGGFFLQQRVELNFMGFDIAGLEVIGYDPATGKFPSTVFASMIGVPIPYEYDVQGDRVTIRTELAGGATFTGIMGRGRLLDVGRMEAGPGEGRSRQRRLRHQRHAGELAHPDHRRSAWPPILTNRSPHPGSSPGSIGERPQSEGRGSRPVQGRPPADGPGEGGGP